MVARLLLIAVVASAMAGAARAQIPAGRPLHILVGFAPGGTTDLAARIIAESVAQNSGRTVLVENRPGAGGRIAAGELKRARPDGTTLLLTPMVTIVLAPLVFRQLQYNPATDFAPVSHVADFQNVLAVAADNPSHSVAEFVAWTRSTGGQASFGTAAAGSQPHFFGMMIGQVAGIGMTHVAYRGAAPLAADLAGGQIAAGISALSDFLALHRAGRLRIIATSGATRSLLLPDVPTFREQGLPLTQTNGWLAFYAPAGTPAATIDQLSKWVVQAINAPDLKGRLVDLGLEPTGSTPESLAATMVRDGARWTPIVKAVGLVAD